MKNLLNDGDPTPFGQKLKGIVVKEIFKKALELSGWKKPKAKNVGRGVAVYERPSGAGKSGAAITIETDGSVSVHLGRARRRSRYSHRSPADRQRSARYTA